MTLANDSVLIAPAASGATVATHLAAGKEYQATILADESGHIVGTVPAYALLIPASAVGASKVYFDLFNAAGSARAIKLVGLWAVPNLDTAVTGAVSVRLYLTRTSTVGTGGTAAAADGATLTAPAITRLNPADTALPAQVSARAAPTGGATAGAWLAEWHVSTEESSASMGHLAQAFNVLRGDMGADGAVVIPEGTGIRVVQGAVASVGTVGFRAVITSN